MTHTSKLIFCVFWNIFIYILCTNKDCKYCSYKYFYSCILNKEINLIWTVKHVISSPIFAIKRLLSCWKKKLTMQALTFYTFIHYGFRDCFLWFLLKTNLKKTFLREIRRLPLSLSSANFSWFAYSDWTVWAINCLGHIPRTNIQIRNYAYILT